MIGVWPPSAPALQALGAYGGVRIERVGDETALWNRLALAGAETACLLPLQRHDVPHADLLPALARYDRCPVLVLLEDGGPRERTVLLERGAADVLTPPFLAAEILARLTARWRALGVAAAVVAHPLRFGDYIVDPAAHTVRDAQGKTIVLTSAEFDLLIVLAAAKGRALSRAWLLEATRGRRWQIADRSIDVMIGRLRGKLEPDPQTPQFIQTVRGFGYRLVGADAPEARGSVSGFGRLRTAFTRR
jgi:DNA-binding response OmpR family regulator